MPTHHRLYLVLATLLTALFAWIGIEFALTERTARVATASIADSAVLFNKAMRGAHANGDDGYLVLAQRTLQNVTAAANAIKQTMQDANRIAKSQEKPTLELTARSGELLKTGNMTLSGLSEAIGDIRTQTLPALNRGISSLADSAVSLNGLISDLRPTAVALTGVVVESGNAVRGLNLAVMHADTLIGDPALRSVAENLATMSLNLTNASGHVNGAAANAEMALGYVRDDLSPKKLPLWQSLLEGALGQAIGLPLKYLPTRVSVVGSVPLPTTPAK